MAPVRGLTRRILVPIDAVSGHPAAAFDGAAHLPGTRAPEAAEPFDVVLGRHLADPRSEIASIRAEIASIRAGAPLRPRQSLRADLASAAWESTAAPGLSQVPGWLQSQLAAQATGNRADPYGWRALSRDTAERVIGPGYGALFERQIQQESGFLPEVVYGFRVSSAGAEGIAQLMPRYYPHVQRSDPVASLQAGAETMRHNLGVWDGDVRRALASYNAGLGRVQSLVAAHGANWESALPRETRDYLAAIVGDAAPRYVVASAAPPSVFGGRGPGGVLTAPVAEAAGKRATGTAVEYLAEAGSPVRSPSDGVVVSVEGGRIALDHGNGWRTFLDGVDGSLAPGTAVRRADEVGVVLAGGVVRLSATSEGRAVDPARYILAG
jgi:soluble lytic murein transglycosylase-like protein